MMGKETTVPAVALAVAHELTSVLLAIVPDPLENTVSDNHPQMRQALWKSRFPLEKFQHTTGAKKSTGLHAVERAMERAKGTVLFYLHHSPPPTKVAQLRSRENFSALINKVRNERGDFITGTIEIQSIIGNCYDQL